MPVTWGPRRSGGSAELRAWPLISSPALRSCPAPGRPPRAVVDVSAFGSGFEFEKRLAKQGLRAGDGGSLPPDFDCEPGASEGMPGKPRVSSMRRPRPSEPRIPGPGAGRTAAWPSFTGARGRRKKASFGPEAGAGRSRPRHSPGAPVFWRKILPVPHPPGVPLFEAGESPTPRLWL